MPSSNACWGIEIGAFALKAIKLEADGDKLKVADYAVIEHPKVLSTPGLDPEDSMRVALGRLIGEHDLSKASIAISVPGHAAFARFAKLPPVEPKKVPDIVKFEAVQQIPFPLEDVEWDYQTFQSPDSPDIEVGIFAMTRERIMQSLRMFRDVELTPDYVSLSPVSVYNAMAYDMEFTEKTPGTILLDVGTTSTDLIIADAGRVWVRTFPMGGHQFTEALVTAFKLSYTKAEKLKKEAEQSKHARHIFQALRPVFTDLVQDVQRSIQYYQQAHPDAQLERLVGLGSTFRLPGLRKYLKQQLGMDTYKLEQFKRVEMEGAGEAEFQALNLNLATAYGMAVQGMGMDTIQANLMPSTMMREAMWKKKNKWFGLSAGVAAAAAGVMFVGPFLDKTAIDNAPQPASITQTANIAQRLGTEARDAGVVGSGVADYTAANMLRLYEDKGVFAHLSRDVSAMIADATDRAGTAEPAFRLRVLDTEFQASAADPGGGFDPRNRDFPPPNDFNNPDPGGAPSGTEGPDLSGAPRIAVTLEISTAQSEPRRFFIDTILAWLPANAEREGVPYVIVPPDADAWQYTPGRAVASNDRAARGSNAGATPGRPTP